MGEQAVARLRWCLGLLTGAALGFALRGGPDGAHERPWLTCSLCAGGLLLLAFDWLVLDDEDYD